MRCIKRNIYLMIGAGILVLLPNLCRANIMERETYGVRQISYEKAIFVDINGSDKGNGEITKPYATVSKALKEIRPGQTIYLREGVYYETISLETSGEEDAYITICSYPGEQAILDNSNGKTEIMVNLNGQSYIDIEGLELRNNKNTWAYGFFMGNGESNIILKNNKVHDLYAKKPSSSNSGANAIICYGGSAERTINNILIEGNEVYDCQTGWNEAISVTGNCEYVSVVNNIVRNTGNIGIDFCGNFGYCEEPSLDQPRYCVARGNIISEETSGNAISYGLYVDGGRDVLLEGNIVYNSQGGIEIGAEESSLYPTKNVIARNNLIFNNSENGITVGGYYTGGGYAKNIKVYNNTVVNNGEENGELVISIVDGLEVANNIFYSEANKPLINSEFEEQYTSNIYFSHNLYYSSNELEEVEFVMIGSPITGLESWQREYESTAMFKKPLFKDIEQDEYELRQGCIGIDSGDDSIDAGEVDLANHLRKQGNIDCGAYETEILTDDEGSIQEPDGTKEDTLLPSFEEEVWYKVWGHKELEIIDSQSISLITPSAWEGLSLWGFEGLPRGKTLEIGYEELGDQNIVQVWADGHCLIELNNLIGEKGSFIVPEATNNIDICIVASKGDTKVTVKKLYIRE